MVCSAEGVLVSIPSAAASSDEISAADLIELSLLFRCEPLRLCRFSVGWLTVMKTLTDSAGARVSTNLRGRVDPGTTARLGPLRLPLQTILKLLSAACAPVAMSVSRQDPNTLYSVFIARYRLRQSDPASYFLPLLGDLHGDMTLNR